jgi:4-aminobutyrate aminotransferase
LAVLDVIESEGLLDQAGQLGERAMEQLGELRTRHPEISGIRGLGLALAVELSSAAPFDAEDVLYECLSRGLSFKVSSGNVLTLMPPLTISPDQLDRAIGIIDASLSVVGAMPSSRQPQED